MNIDAIRSYIQTDILGDDSVHIEFDEDLLLSETLDSHSIMRLVAHLEDGTGLEIPPEHITLEHFGTLRQIEAYLASRGVAPALATPQEP